MSNPDDLIFEAFVLRVEPGLRRALFAALGLDKGREATAEALAWAWEHWGRVKSMDNPTGYLFRVGQSRSRSPRTPAVFIRPAPHSQWAGDFAWSHSQLVPDQPNLSIVPFGNNRHSDPLWDPRGLGILEVHGPRAKTGTLELKGMAAHGSLPTMGGGPSHIHPINVRATTRRDARSDSIRPDQKGRAVSRNRQTGTGTPS
jgi:hypothetical protein